jgi:hypothetical protein
MFVEPEKRANCCPYGKFYKYRTIGAQKIEKEAVKCLFKGNIYDADYITRYCAGQFKNCEVYKREEKIADWRTNKDE